MYEHFSTWPGTVASGDGNTKQTRPHTAEMFAKPASFKPFSAIKGSERKNILSRIEKQLGIQADADLKTHLLPKATQSAKVLLHSGKKAQVYGSDAKHPLWILIDDTFIPTAYLVSDTQDILPTVYTVPNTLDYLQNGADFMAPGIFGQLPQKASPGSAVQIRDIDSNEIMAVGIALVDLANPPDKGKAVEVVNVNGDTLNGDLIWKKKKEAPPATKTDNAKSSEPAAAPAAAPPEAEMAEITLEEADAAFESAFSRVLATHHEYPIDMAAFATLLKENLGMDIVIKQTSWKKMAKFLKEQEKKGLVSLRERQGGDIVVMSAQQTEPLSEDQGAPRQSSKTKKKVTGIEAYQLYRPRSALKPLGFVGEYLTAAELKKQVADYLTSHDLGTGREIRPDAALQSIIGGAKDLVLRDEIMPAVLKNCAVHHVIFRTGDENSKKIKKGVIPKINIKTQRRGGNKVVTIVTGMEAFYVEPKELAEELRVACAGSTSADKGSVLVQGNHVDKICRVLEGHSVRPAWIQR